ncbi:MAG: hypothetical protein NC110_05305 [Ruminococcus sp.]|nr:hypothetical protein [Ruminococcus sp.]
MRVNFNYKSPKWSAQGNEPNDDTKKRGFLAGYKPPASIFNWFWCLVSNCIEELQQITSSFAEEYNVHKHSASDITSGTLPVTRGGTGATTAANALKNLGVNVAAEVINLLDGVRSNIQNQIDSKANSAHSHATSDITSGILPVARGGTGANSAADARNKLGVTPANIGAEPALGFTPIQQGGGTDQRDNKIYIGWTDKMLKAQVDATDMGAIITDGDANNAVLPVKKGGTGATTAANALKNLGVDVGNSYVQIGNTLIQWGTYTATAEDESSQILFNKEYSAAPQVFINVKTSAPDKKFAAATEIAKNLFWLYYHSNDTAHKAGMSWFAVGKA